MAAVRRDPTEQRHEHDHRDRDLHECEDADELGGHVRHPVTPEEGAFAWRDRLTLRLLRAFVIVFVTAGFLVYITIFLLIPTITVVIGAFQGDAGEFSLDKIRALGEETALRALRESLVLSFSSAVVGAVLGALTMEAEVGIALGLATAVAAAVVALRERSLPWLGVAAITMLWTMPRAADAWFPGRLSAALTLILTGGALVGAAVWVARHQGGQPSP